MVIRNRIAAVVLAVASALGISVATALPASAYVAKTCTVYITARLSATAWQLSSTTERLHMDLNGYYPTSGLKLYPYRLLLDGYVMGTWNDTYADRRADLWHKVQGQWTGSDGNLYVCSVSIAPYPGY